MFTSVVDLFSEPFRLPNNSDHNILHSALCLWLSTFFDEPKPSCWGETLADLVSHVQPWDPYVVSFNHTGNLVLFERWVGVSYCMPVEIWSLILYIGLEPGLCQWLLFTVRMDGRSCPFPSTTSNRAYKESNERNGLNGISGMIAPKISSSRETTRTKNVYRWRLRGYFRLT